MEKLIYIFFLMLYGIQGWSLNMFNLVKLAPCNLEQVKIENNENDSLVVKDTILLSEEIPDKYRIMLPSNGKGEQEEDADYHPTYMANTSYAVGRINGVANVSQTGGATYQISIEVPKGVAGFQPEITVSYSSQSGSGILGYGWSLNASSLITRTGKSFYHDGSVEAPDFSSKDNLLLDGQRLILVSGTNFVNGAKYRTEVESYSDITYKVTGSYAYLEVKTKDGRVLEYGATDNSSIKASQSGVILFWLLSKVTDKEGNEMTYTYDKVSDQIEFYLSSIQYGGDRKIKFTYEDRLDKQISYIAGVSVNNKKILKRISTYISDIPLKEYQFNHIYDNLYTKLSEIVEWGKNNERYNSTLINYTSSDIQASEDIASLSENRQGNKPVFADFNGDGKTDFISFPEKESYTSSDVATLFLATEVFGSTSFKKQCTIPLPERFLYIIPADMNGDSRIDAVVVSLAPNGTYRYNYYMWENDKLVYNYLGFNTNGSTGIAGDFNGDGKFEILVKENQKVFDGRGNEIALGGIDDWGTEYVSSFANNLYLTDFNGNGKTDLLVMNSSKSWVYELNGNKFARLPSFETTHLKNYYFPYFGDFNGDGKTDVLYQNVQSGDYDDVHILFSTGRNFVKHSISSAVNIRSKVNIGDFNKDGKSDIFHMEIVNGSVVMKISIYDGNDFITKQYSSILDPEDFIVPHEYDSYLFPIADFNGDGRSEFCCARFIDSYVIHTFDDEQNLLVKTISDGLGEYTTFNYQPITKSGVCNIDENLSFPLTNSKFPLYVVSSVTTNGTNYNDYTTYVYKNPRTHKQGKGFLGFGEIIAKNNATAVNTVTKYGYDNSHYYPWVIEQKTEAKMGTSIQTITNEYATVLGKGKIFYPYIRKQTVADHLKGTVISETASNLEYGNPKTIIKDYGSGLIETTTSVFNNITTGNKWILGLLASITKNTIRGGASWIDKTVFEYNTNNQVSSKTVYTNTGQELVSEETYTYDRFGNIVTSILKPYSSSNVLTTTYQYSSNGVYETGMTDPLGRTTTQIYNSLGQLASSTDIRGKITTYEYDGLGRLVKTNYPDGTYVSINREWSSTGVGVYSLTNKGPGSPTVTVYYDSRELELRTSQMRFDGSKLFIDNTYDNAGRLVKVSLPFKGSAPSLWNTYKYDVFGRLEQISYASGKIETYAYSGGSVTETKNGISITKTYNSKGELIGTSDFGGTISYQLRPDGQPASITAPGNIKTNFSYDSFGRQTEIIDPSIGTKVFGYDAAGNINYEKDANGKEKNMTYNKFGQLTERTLPEYTTTFVYDECGGIQSESSTNGTSKSYERDSLGRLIATRETVDTHWSQINYTYSLITGLLEAKVYTFSSGVNAVAENYLYQNGSLTEIKQDGQNSIWKLLSEDYFGHPVKVSTGPLTRTYSYDEYGFPTTRKTVSSSGTVLQDFVTLFDPITGNLKARGDNKYNKFEQFRYDNLNRLTNVYLATSLTSSPTSDPINFCTYQNNGNLLTKNDVGTFSYNDLKKPYAVTGVELYGKSIPSRSQTVTYTSFERPETLVENSYTAVLTYNGSSDRVKMNITKNNNREILRYYLNGSHEVDQTPAGERERLYMGGDAYSAPAVLVKESGRWSLYYICRDYLGSITHLSDKNGTLKQELCYDAWGRLRNPNSLIVYSPDAEPELFLGRGYTGHEHLAMFGLVNMNARLYDPLVGRFLSPDPYVQTPDFTQSYNRFSYAMNNPLMYVDPNGENPLAVILGISSLVGAYIGGVAANQGELNPFRWNYSSITTYLGLGFGALVGYYGAYGVAYPGSMAFGGSISTPWISAGTSVAALGKGTNWQFNFHWTTAAGGGGEYGHLGDVGNTVDMAIKNAQPYYYHSNSQGTTIDPVFVLSTTLSGTSEAFYSKQFNTWMGKDLKIRSQNWGGNQHTGGKYKFAKQMSRNITWGGNIVGFYNGIKIYRDFQSSNISFSQLLLEESSNAYSTLGGVYGAAWSVGWEMGRQITNQAWYQQFKYRFWYNRMENLYGSPSEENRLYWDDFYNNYRP